MDRRGSFPVAESRNFHTDPIDDIIYDLIQTTNEDDLDRLQALEDIKTIQNRNEKLTELVGYLYKYAKQSDESIYRLCNQLFGHIEFLYRLNADQETQSLFLISQQTGKTFLRDATRDFLAEQAGRTTQLIESLVKDPQSPLFSIDKITNIEFNPKQRTEVLKNLAKSQSVSVPELRATLEQESYIVQLLLTYIQENKRKKALSSASTYDEVKKAIDEQYQDKIASLEEQIRQLSRSEDAIRRQIQLDLQKEYNDKLLEMKETLRIQISREQRPIRQPGSPQDEGQDPKNITHLKQQITQEIRASVIDELRNDLMEECEYKVRGKVKKEVKAKLEPLLRSKIESELRSTLPQKLRPEIEKELTPKLRLKISQEIRDEVRENETERIKEELKPELERILKSRIRNQVIEEIEPQLRKQIEDELKEKLTLKLKSQLRKELRDQIYETVADDARDDIEQQLREEFNARIAEAEKNVSVPEWRIVLLKDSLRAELELEYGKKLERMEEEMRRRVFNDLRQETLDEISFNDNSQLSDFGQLKEMFRPEIEAEYRSRLQISKPTGADLERLRAQIKLEYAGEVEAKLADEIQREVDKRVRTSAATSPARPSRSDPVFGLSVTVHDRAEFERRFEGEVNRRVREELERRTRDGRRRKDMVTDGYTIDPSRNQIRSTIKTSPMISNNKRSTMETSPMINNNNKRTTMETSPMVSNKTIGTPNKRVRSDESDLSFSESDQESRHPTFTDSPVGKKMRAEAASSPYRRPYADSDSDFAAVGEDNEIDIERIREEIRAELLQTMTPRKPIDVGRLREEIRAEVERELRSDIEKEIRARLAEEERLGIDKQRRFDRATRESVFKEIRELMENPDAPAKSSDVRRLKQELEEKLRPQVEASVRRELLTLETNTEADLNISADILKRARRELLPRLRREADAEVAGAGAVELFAAICRALGIGVQEFSVQRLHQFAGQLARECIEIRGAYEIPSGPLLKAFADLSERVHAATLFEAHVRGIMTRQAAMIDSAQSENCAAAWNAWARELYRSLAGEEFASQSAAELRAAIDERQSRLSAENSLLRTPQRPGSPSRGGRRM